MTCFFSEGKIWSIQKKLSKLQNNIPTRRVHQKLLRQKKSTPFDVDFHLFVIEY